ncbi:MAG: hypothetical protein V1672_02835 [Candidatus Diapherotrites archaeon]
MKALIIGILAFALIFSGCVQTPDNQIVGGDKDEHGCIGSAGYSWCEAKQKCLRTWEEPCETQEITNFDECAAAGNPVMESYPRQCRDPVSGNSFTEVIEMSEEFCNGFGGHWNECSSKCGIDNQGRFDIACPTVCAELCECGGIAGFGCPGGYTCKMPSGIADALGYCVPAGEMHEIEHLSESSAIEIAEASECIAEGTLTDEISYNEVTKTWWINLNLEKEGCNPACVVSEETGTAEINWRCTGLIVE